MPFMFSPTVADQHVMSAKSARTKAARYSLDSEVAVDQRLEAGADADSDAESYEDYADEDCQDIEDDITMGGRRPRMSFGGRAYPPVPPEASTLPPPVDLWASESDRTVQSRQSIESLASVYQYAPVEHPYNRPPQLPQHYESIAHQRQPSAPRANAWSPYYEGDDWQQQNRTWGYNAPYLAPADLGRQYADMLQRQQNYAASVMGLLPDPVFIPTAPTPEMLNESLAHWYVDQVLDLLVRPGQFRVGAGGQSEEVWGAPGREKESWDRLELSPPDYSDSWGRMGMSPNGLLAQGYGARALHLERKDPWNVAWRHANGHSETLIAFVTDMIQRMSISPTAIASALWYLAGLGLHEGDGVQGNVIRKLLKSQSVSDLEGVEKRVTTLGLILAGKYLDDNAFLTKSWTEVTSIPIKHLDAMENAALKDLKHSLFISVASWVDHVNKLYGNLVSKTALTQHDAVIVGQLDRMVTDAREVEITDPKFFAPAEAEVSYPSQVYAVSPRPVTDAQFHDFAYNADVTHDFDVDEAERNVAQLVDDQAMGEDYEDEEDFLDYDGAKQWLPSASELRRSTSNSSAVSADSINAWRATIPHPEPFAPSQPSSQISYEYDPFKGRMPVEVKRDPFTHYSNNSLSNVHKHGSDHCQHCSRAPALTTKDLPYPYRTQDVYLEPGISIFRPTAAAVYGSAQG